MLFFPRVAGQPIRIRLFARTGREIVAWGMIVVHGLVVSGLPLPLPDAPDSARPRLAEKDRSRPFPCQDKPCGCATAEQCFSSCCCNTPAELLVWAKANRVEPGVIAALRRRVGVAAPEKPAATSCCAAVRRAACCSEAPAELPHQPAGEPVSRETIVLSSMLACGGIVSQWLAIGSALPPPAVVAVVLVAPLVEPCADGDDVCRAERVEPDAPPPRVA